MPSVGFKKRFAYKVQRNLKNWTIRKFRKIPIKVGDRLYLFTAMRTKWCKKLGEGICDWKSLITIYENKVVVANYKNIDGSFSKRVFGTKYWQSDIEWFARRDGFKNWADMKAYWIAENGPDCLPFTGEIICWKRVRPLKKVKTGRQAVARKFVKELEKVIRLSKGTSIQILAS